MVPIYNDTGYSTTGQKSTVGPVSVSVLGATGPQIGQIGNQACSNTTYEACSSALGTLNAPSQGDKGYIYWNYPDKSCVCNRVNVVLSPAEGKPNGKVIPIDLLNIPGGGQQCIHCTCPYVGGNPPIDATECNCVALRNSVDTSQKNPPQPCKDLATKFGQQ